MRNREVRFYRLVLPDIVAAAGRGAGANRPRAQTATASQSGTDLSPRKPQGPAGRRTGSGLPALQPATMSIRANFPGRNAVRDLHRHLWRNSAPAAPHQPPRMNCFWRPRLSLQPSSLKEPRPCTAVSKDGRGHRVCSPSFGLAKRRAPQE